MKKFIIGILLIAIVGGALYLFKDNISFEDIPIIETKKDLGYTKKSKEKIEELGLESYINDTYYKTLDKALESNIYINDYLNSYVDIDYIENENFIEYVNYLLEKNYNASKINEINFLFNNDYYKNEYLERYIKYYESNKSIPKDNMVMYVNIGLDNDFYTNIKTIKNPDDLLVIVNKYNKLPDDYSPTDLKSFELKYMTTNRERKLKSVAYDALIKMIDDITKEGYDLKLVSGWRSKSYQNMLFTNSVKKNGMAHALLYSAKPRHSEHETGLAADISISSGILDGFEKCKEYTWLKENAYKYGFIERYPKGKEHITGYGYEPWHWRYVGIETATIIKNENITFEEYAVKYLNY